ncbi:hypothetical protein [Nocardioides kribbensis]|uniref:DUF222 domain-containing protein n=1 Tax=Nocardioides kribbensis TaxID=305517 RepID=A0ABV1P1N2_9ACTN
MTWNSHRNRGEILRAVIAAADARVDGLLPLDVEGATTAFHDELDLLGALQLRWHTRLSGRIERELVHQPMALEDAVVAAWRGTADEMPGVRAVLDHYRAEPRDEVMAAALRKASAKEHHLLAVMAGQAGTHATAAAARAGARIEARARAGWRPGASLEPAVAHRSAGLLGRLRAALAA